MIVAVQQSQPSISIDTRASVSIESQGGVLVIQMAGGLPGPQGPAGTGNGNFPSPPDQTGTWAPIFVAGVLQWFEVVLIAGGGVTGQDGTAAAVGTEVTSQTGTALAVGTGTTAATSSELASQTGAASATGTGATTATGSAATSEAGAAASTGTGTTTAVGSEGSAEAGTATPYVLNPGSAAATGTQASAETGTATATGSGTTASTGTEGTAEAGTATASAIAAGATLAIGTEGSAESGAATATGSGTTGATGAESAAESGTATASATSSGSAAATGSEGTAQTGTASATGTGTAAATGAQGTSEAGTATASGGGGGPTITENFDTAIPTTYSINPTYPSNMAATATVQGWTIGSSGTDPATFDVYDSFYGAYIRTTTGGFAGNCLSVAGCHTEDTDANILGESGFKASKTWAGPFASGTLSIKYKATGGAARTIKVNGVSVGALTQDNAWHTASIALTDPANITIELECAPSTNGPTSIAVDDITYS